MAGFFWFSLDFSGRETLIATRSRDLAVTEASLDIIRDEVGYLIASAGKFRKNLSQTIDILDIEETKADPAVAGSGGDLASLFAIEQMDGSTMVEVSDLQDLRSALEQSADDLGNIGMALSRQKELLSDIPTIWPLKDVRGWVTQIFGPSINPFGHHWYLHRGLDLAFGYGVPIIATADGKVVKKDYDAYGFGYYIDIQHKYGFKTRFAHLQRQMVEVGQRVTQGEIIGTMGNSGRSTGPHLHYEVMIGTQLVDPIKFLHMSNSDESLGDLSTNLKRYR